jgi:hypothetical protein
MHFTLRPGFNVTAIVLWIGVGALAVSRLSPVPWVYLFAAISLGACLGFMQSRAVSASVSRFTAATSAREIRRLLLADPQGRGAIWGLWIGVGVLIVWAAWQSRSQFLATIISGYALLAAARESIALTALYSLQRDRVV